MYFHFRSKLSIAHSHVLSYFLHFFKHILLCKKLSTKIQISGSGMNVNLARQLFIGAELEFLKKAKFDIKGQRSWLENVKIFRIIILYVLWSNVNSNEIVH